MSLNPAQIAQELANVPSKSTSKNGFPKWSSSNFDRMIYFEATRCFEMLQVGAISCGSPGSPQVNPFPGALRALMHSKYKCK